MKRGILNHFLLAGLAVFALLAGPSSSEAASPAAAKQGSADDMRVLYTTVTDIAEGKRVAAASCARCHGADGVATAKGVPHIAGQRPVYLYVDLRAYKAGARGDTPMGAAVKFLSDDALVKVSAYYASLDPAQPSSAGAAKAAPAAPDPVKAGRGAAAGCAGCHGDGGISSTPGMPSLVGLDPKYLVSATNAYKNGQRKNEMMKTLVAGVGEADIKNMALYFALQKPARAKTPAPGDQAAGKAAAAACSGCHGEQGVSSTPETPSLAGQDAQYFIAAIKAYKDGTRDDPSMKAPAAALEDKTVRDLAAYYAALKPQAPKVTAPMSAAAWAQRCDRCHGINGNSTDPRVPALAAQRLEYLETMLRAYQKGTIKSPQMAAMSAVLSETDVVNLAVHYARQKPRAFVYVVVPGK